MLRAIYAIVGPFFGQPAAFVTHRRVIITALCLGLAPATYAHGASPGRGAGPAASELCETDELAGLLRPDTGASDQGPVRYEADAAQSTPELATLSGNVEVNRGDQRLLAPRLELDRKANIGYAREGAEGGTPQFAFRAKKAEIALDQNVGRYDDAEYFMGRSNAQGSATKVVDDRDKAVTDLEQATYSTCKRGDEFWQIRADTLNLDYNTGRGVAHDATVAIGGVPVLYSPYLSFPITDERQSGFLTPRLSSSSGNGFDLALPYYWNIAPNQDATFTPRVITDRGFQLGTEYRYLGTRGSGEFYGEYLPNDREAERDRGMVDLRARGIWFPGLSSSLIYDWVSDDDYFRDLGNQLDVVDTAYLQRTFDTTYSVPFGGVLLTRFQGYQTLDAPDFTRVPPYSRLPQMIYFGGWDRGPLRYDLRTEVVAFEHPTKVTGTRFDIEPAVSLPLEWSYAFVRPRVAYRQTQYQLDYPGNTGAANDTSPSRGAPILSLDSGLIFERPLSFGDSAFTQTLEPRLYYLRVPYRSQGDIPVFDTTLVNTSFNALFYDNRFVGTDRLGDANQLTTAVSTRIIGAADGRERMRLSLGQIQYFEDRRVALGADQLVDTGSSDLIAEGQVTLGRDWYLRIAAQWDPHNEEARRNAVDLRYRGERGAVFNIAYRYSNAGDPPAQGAPADTDQIDLTGVLPVNPRWRLFGRWNYSMLDEHVVDTFAGVEYSDCCWAVRMLGRQYRDYPQDEEAKNAFFLEFELKGLSSIGAGVDQFLNKSILGYTHPGSTSRY